MSEELENKEQEVKKKVSRKREVSEQSNDLIEQYQYVPKENEVLIMDRPSEPIIKESIKKIITPMVVLKSNKELYESYIKELKNFSLSINGEIIYDSSIDNTGVSPVKFENDFFILYGKKYSYNGLKVQKINRR